MDNARLTQLPDDRPCLVFSWEASRFWMLNIPPHPFIQFLLLPLLLFLLSYSYRDWLYHKVTFLILLLCSRFKKKQVKNFNMVFHTLFSKLIFADNSLKYYIFKCIQKQLSVCFQFFSSSFINLRSTCFGKLEKPKMKRENWMKTQKCKLTSWKQY